jgi:type I restriction enzyme S subunit
VKEPSTAWPEVPLGEICEFKYGKSLPGPLRADGDVPVYGSNGVVGVHSEAITSGPTIVVGRKGSFGEVAFSPRSCWPIDTTYYIDRTATKADLRWLAYRLSALGLTGLNRAAAIPGLNREDAYRQRLLLPSLPEQRQIAEILDRAEALRAKRRAGLAQLDTLTQSIFLDMFGDPAAKGWRMSTVAKVARSGPASIRTGPFGSQLLHGEFVDQGVAVLGIDNVVFNEFRWGKRRFISEEKYRQLRRYTVRPGDVLITIMGTCGRCAIVPDDIPVAINTKHLCCITLDPRKCLPEFLHGFFLRHPLARRYLERMAKGAIMAGLNMEIIKAMPIPLPPVELQEEFADRVAVIEHLKAVHQASRDKLDALFVSLQRRAFRGEL